MSKRSERNIEPAGHPKSIKARLLELGADLMQDVAPMKQFDIYVAGLHCARHRPERQMSAHHYCRQVNQDFLQCVLFDGNTKEANLIGVEYIISERLFEQLPEEEKAYWHPHNYEILSGQLVAPGLPDVAEKAMLEMLMNSYGKTWHTWHTGGTGEHAGGDDLPLGEAMLMWSFNRDGEADPGLRQALQQELGYSEEQKRRHRADLAERAHPQRGVDTLKEAFPNAAELPPPGVRDAGTAAEVDRGPGT